MAVPSRLVLCSVVFAAFTSAAARAQQWVPLVSGVPKGTPAKVEVHLEKSTSQRTEVEVTIYGFWRWSVVGDDGTTYDRIEVPGLPPSSTPGAPELPVLRSRLALVTDAAEMKLVGVADVKEQKVKEVVVYPLPIPGSDEELDPNRDPGEGNTKGSEEKFTKDPTIYGQTDPWPKTNGPAQSPVDGAFGPLRTALAEGFPAHWNPATHELSIMTSAKFLYDHAGELLPAVQLTKPQAKLGAAMFPNWAKVDDYAIVDLAKYDARYLIVTPQGYDAALKPLVDLKKAQGFQVTVKHLTGGESWIGIVNLIQSWYGDPSEDHYCLLVGDTNVIPHAVLVNGVPTDDVFGSPADWDLQEEIWVGRLSVDGASDLAHQVDKIVQYQTSPVAGGAYDKVLLVAHEEGAPGKYQGAHEAVRTESYYSYPPTFLTRYGAQWMTNAQVKSDVEAGLGLVCYRGHGSTNTWSGWNESGESWHKNDVVLLQNLVQPVVWSIACTNHNLQTSGGGSVDCIGEAWLEADHGAVASYAATVGTGTKANHELDLRLFEAVYDFGITTHAHAISYGENRMTYAFPESNNAWAYNLLGDPSMKIRVRPPKVFVPELAAKIDILPGVATELVVKVKDETGKGKEGLLVSMWKPGAEGKDEVLVNRYTDGKGVATLPVTPKSAGKMTYSIQDEDGNTQLGTVELVTPCVTKAGNEEYGQGKAGSSGVPKLAAADLPILGQPSSIVLSNALPGAFPILVLGLSAADLPFDGGTLLVHPLVFAALPTAVKEDGTLVIGATIPDDPTLCGLDLYHQMIVVDPGAGGFYQAALTNALHRRFGAN